MTRKIMELIPLEYMSQHMEDTKGIREPTWFHEVQIVPD